MGRLGSCHKINLMKAVSTNRQIARNMFYNVVVYVINLGISFFLTPYLIRTVGKEAYSFFPLVNNLIGYTSIITTAVGSMGGRFMTMAYYRDDKKAAEEYFNSLIFAYWLLSLVFSVVLLVCCIYIYKILNIPNYLISDIQWLFGLSSVTMIIGLCTGLLGIGTYLKNRIDLSSKVSAISSIVNVVCIVALYHFFKPSIVYVAIASLVCTIIGVGFNIHFKRSLLPDIHFAPIKLHSWAKIKEMTMSGVWNSVNRLSDILLLQLDILVTNILLSASAAGDMALVKTVPNLIFSFTGMLSGAFTPNFNILYAQGKMDELVHEVNKSMLIMGTTICIPIAFLAVCGDQFYHLWVPTQDNEYLYHLSATVILPIIIGGSIIPVYGIFTITNKLRIPSIVLLITGLLTVGCYVILLKTTNLGIWAIVIIDAIQRVIRNFFFTPIYAARCLKLKWNVFYKSIFKGFYGLACAAVITFAIKQVLPVNSWIMFILEFCIVGAISLALNIFTMLNNSERNYLYSVVRASLNKIGL